jgi:hypothetical protein
MPKRAAPVGWVAIVRRIEDGFFTARAEPPARTSAQFPIRFVDGMSAITQFFRLHWISTAWAVSAGRVGSSARHRPREIGSHRLEPGHSMKPTSFSALGPTDCAP